MTYRFKFI